MPELSIDHDKCQGHGRCYSLAPQWFGYDSLGAGVVNPEGTGLTPEDADAALRIVQSCPEEAISLTDS